LRSIAVEVTNQSGAVLSGALGQNVNKGFDQIPAGITQSGGSTVVGGIGLHEAGIELVLAHQEAKAIAEARLAVVVTIIIIVSVRGRILLLRWSRGVRSRGPTEFLNRTEPDAVGLAEGAVDGSCFGDAHLGAVDQGRDVGWIGVPVADETARAGGFVDGRLKDPTT
jgi:hypothetical protein